MEIEDIAKIDLYLRSENGLDNILDIENLIIAQGDEDCILKLKNGSYRLQDRMNERLKSAKTTEVDELQQTWQNLFAKQVRQSVDRAKQKK